MVPAQDDRLNAAVYAELRKRLFIGKIAPGSELSTRGLAGELGVSQTPVRDALSRLAAEGAVEIRSKRRVQVPTMSTSRYEDLLRCRLLLEPEAAVQALPGVDGERLSRLRESNASIERAAKHKDWEALMEHNHAFHFTLYRAQEQNTLTQLIETLWLQLGPYLRTACGTANVAAASEQSSAGLHDAIIEAVVNKDEARLKHAIAEDISVGMRLIDRSAICSAR